MNIHGSIKQSIYLIYKFSAAIMMRFLVCLLSASHSKQNDMMGWAVARGIQGKAEICCDDMAGGGRGLIATQDCAPGEVVLRVPLSATLRLEGDCCATENEDDNWAGTLASKLMGEKKLGSSSHFETYLENGLPDEAPLTPCRWTSTERLALQNYTFVEESRLNAEWRTRQVLRNQPSNVVEYLKMLDLVCSRTLKGRSGSRQLVPVMDIANHAPSETGGGHFQVVENDAVYLIAGSRGVNAGEPVLMDYGGRSVDDFLMHYGFVPDRCLSDCVLVPIEAGHRTLSWNDCQGYNGHPEAGVRQACEDLLMTFPTTLEEDVALLNELPLDTSEATRNALQYRYAKKSLLASVVGMQSSSARRSAFSFNHV